MRASFAAAYAVFFFTAPAAADAVLPPPTDCVEGSEAVFCHGPPTCRALACATDADCASGTHCAPRALCLSDHSCGGILGAPVYDHASGACRADGSCAEGTCTNGSYCVPDGGLDGGPAPDGGGRDASTGPDARTDEDATTGTDAGGSGTDVGGGLDSGARADGGGVLVTTYGCGCRAGSGAPAPVGLLVLAAVLAARRWTR